MNKTPSSLLQAPVPNKLRNPCGHLDRSPTGTRWGAASASREKSRLSLSFRAQFPETRPELIGTLLDTRFYSLTAAGKRQLKAETAKWTDMAAVVAGILNKRADEI